MKRAASFLAFIALAAALTIGVGAQQQTFSTAHAGPTGPVPIITGQPVNGDIYPGYYPYPCNGSGGKGSGRPGVNPNPNPNPNPRGGKTSRNPCTGARPTARPSRPPSPRPSPRPT